MKNLIYSLITVLYDNSDADLYNEIYFPIVRYSLVKGFLSADGPKSLNYEDLRGFINSTFGIEIPTTVLRQCLVVITDKYRDCAVRFLGEDSFIVEIPWNSEKDNDVQKKLEDIEGKIDDLERGFTEYLKSKEIQYNKTLSDFFSNNTKDLLVYLKNGSSSLNVGEEYVHVLKYLEFLRDSNAELYSVANDIFWASCLAAYLQRNNVDLKIRPASSLSYYLDSKLVLALLDLDAEEQCNYVKGIVSSIQNSGNKVCVSGITLREIRQILESIIASGNPNENSSIALGYERLKMKLHDLVSLRNNLNNLLCVRGVLVCDTNESAISDNVKRCSRNPFVKQLYCKRRGCDIEDVTSTNDEGVAENERTTNTLNVYGFEIKRYFREIHDVCMMNYVTKCEQKQSHQEKIGTYFITFNVDLIDFYKEHYQKDVNLLIHPSKVQTELWLHNTSSAQQVKKESLTETIGRCLALNQVDALHKIKKLASEMDEEVLDSETAICIYQGLINRSQDVLNAFNKMSNETTKESKSFDFANLVKAAKERQRETDQSLAQHEKSISEINVVLNEAKREIEKLKSENGLLQNNNDLSNSMLCKMTEENQRLQKINLLRKEKDEIQKDLAPLEIERKKYPSYKGFYAQMIVEILLVLLFVASVFYLMSSMETLNLDSLKNVFQQNGALSVTGIISLLFFVAKGMAFNKLFIFSRKQTRDEIKVAQLDIWDKNHEDYKKKRDRLEEIEKELRNLENIK
jgi:hypothetical protein